MRCVRYWLAAIDCSHAPTLELGRLEVRGSVLRVPRRTRETSMRGNPCSPVAVVCQVGMAEAVVVVEHCYRLKVMVLPRQTSVVAAVARAHCQSNLAV